MKALITYVGGSILILGGSYVGYVFFMPLMVSMGITTSWLAISLGVIAGIVVLTTAVIVLVGVIDFSVFSWKNR